MRIDFPKGGFGGRPTGLITKNGSLDMLEIADPNNVDIVLPLLERL